MIESVITSKKLTRKCGDCTSCCSILALRSLGKPYHCDCEHLGQGCCKIYNDRPVDCRSYECLWLAGLGGNQDRPKDSGLLLTIRIDEGKLYVDVHETEPGVIKRSSDQLQRIMDELPRFLPQWARKLFNGVCLFPHDIPVGQAFPSRDPYPETPIAGMSFMKKRNILLYVGPTVEDEDPKSSNMEKRYLKSLELVGGKI